jgi:hypothetical protein
MPAKAIKVSQDPNGIAVGGHCQHFDSEFLGLGNNTHGRPRSLKVPFRKFFLDFFQSVAHKQRGAAAAQMRDCIAVIKRYEIPGLIQFQVETVSEFF